MHNVGTVMRVTNHYMVGIVLGILAALVAGAVLAFVVMKHLRKKKKGELLLCSLLFSFLDFVPLDLFMNLVNWNIAAVALPVPDVLH